MSASGGLSLPGAGGSLTDLLSTQARSSGQVANAPAVATLPAVGGFRAWLTGFDVFALGSIAQLLVTVAVAGITLPPSYLFNFPAGVSAEATRLAVQFARPIPASALGVAITVTLPAGGAGNTAAMVNAYGFYTSV